jgi:hypothetical protein
MDPGVVDTMGRGEDMSPAYDCSATVGILVGLIPPRIDDHLNSICVLSPHSEIKMTALYRLRGSEES